MAVQAMSFQEHTGTLGQVAQIPLMQLPAQAAQAFKDQFEALQHEVDWMQDSTLFEKKAREVLDNTCSADLRQQLSAFTTSSNAPSALLLSGLPVEDHLPPTVGDPPIAKVGSEY